MTLSTAFAFLALSFARADTVYLKNGNSLEGTIASEKGGEILLNIGYGTVSLRKAEIRKIVRSKGSGGEIARREFESGRRVPEGSRDLQDLLQAAQASREKAREAREREKESAESARQTQEELSDLRERYRNGTDPEELDRIRAEMAISGNRLQDARVKGREGGKEIQEYFDAYRKLQASLDSAGVRSLAGRARGWEADYFAWVRREAAEMAGDFRKDVVSSVGEGGHVIVQAILNGRVPARLLVDTGASISVLYPSITEELGLKPQDEVGTSQIIVGDGRAVTAKMVRLDSIAVGKSVVRDPVVALVASPAPGIDGLLGMSFLRNFIVRVDSANGKLILETLKEP